jgi:outer membrane protein TolC
MRRGRCTRAAGAAALLVLASLAAARAETLTEAWDAAIAADRRLSAARRTTDAARESLAAAEGARAPRLTLEAGYQRLDEEPGALVTTPTATSKLPLAEEDSRSYRAALSVPLYTGGRIARGIDAAQAGLEASDAEERRALADLKLAVAATYLDALRARRAHEVAARNVESLAAHARDVDGRHRRGLVARNQLLAAEVALADARQRALRAANRLDVAHAAYNRLLGRALTETVALAEPDAPPPAGEVEALTAQALRQRPELAASGEQARALRHQAAAERAAGYPQLELGLGQSYEENRYRDPETLRSANLGLRWELYDGGVIRHRAAASARRAEALAEERADLESRVRLQVREAWLDAHETGRRVPVTREGVEQSEENLRVARARYREGLGTHTEVLDAESQRTLSYTNYYSAVYDAALAGLRLRHAVGEL